MWLTLDAPAKGVEMGRADDIALWHEVNSTIIGLPSVVEIFAKRAVARIASTWRER